MKRRELVDIYNAKYLQAGDTHADFHNWAIDYLLDLLNKAEVKNERLISRLKEVYHN